jgi:hypothetical protein
VTEDRSPVALDSIHSMYGTIISQVHAQRRLAGADHAAIVDRRPAHRMEIGRPPLHSMALGSFAA